MDFILRPWAMSDLDDLVKFANNHNVAKYLMDRFPHPYTREDGVAFIGMTSQNHPPNILAIEVEGRASGGIGVHFQEDVYRRNAELGYWLAEPYWGKGIMSAAIPQMVEYAFKNFEIDRIFARPFGTNIASRKTLEKVGFILEARFEKTFIKEGQLLDELVYAKRRNQC
jgi:RimJ/RimL family protein N-acetyltransferase